MLQKITAVAITAITTFSIGLTANGNIGTTNSEAYIPSETIETLAIDTADTPLEKYILVEVPILVPVELTGNFLKYQDTNDFSELCQLLTESEQRKKSANKMMEAARECGYPEDHPIIILAQEEWAIAHELSQIYQEKIDKTNLAKAWHEYPVATEIWIHLTQVMGYNNYVAAGILGNMMVECGGLTLHLDWTAVNKNSGCYGLCQWHPYYHQEIQNCNLQQQIAYMTKSFPELLSQYAYVYSSNFTYEDFLNLTDARIAARAFSYIYERPGIYHTVREDMAEKAYDYFVK
jgi:hypothetical protein